MITHQVNMFPNHGMTAKQVTDHASVFHVRDGDETIVIVIFKEESMDFGEHTIMATCGCSKNGKHDDDCPHIQAAMNQVMTCTFTFNDREG